MTLRLANYGGKFASTLPTNGIQATKHCFSKVKNNTDFVVK